MFTSPGAPFCFAIDTVRHTPYALVVAIDFQLPLLISCYGYVTPPPPRYHCRDALIDDAMSPPPPL